MITERALKQTGVYFVVLPSAFSYTRCPTCSVGRYDRPRPPDQMSMRYRITYIELEKHIAYTSDTGKELSKFVAICGLLERVACSVVYGQRCSATT